MIGRESPRVSFRDEFAGRSNELDDDLNGGSFGTTGVLFGFAFLSSASYVLTSALGVSLYLARVGANSLPVVLLASAIAVVLASSVTYSLTLQLSTKRCILAAWFVLAMVSLTIAYKLENAEETLYWLVAIYVLAEIRGCLNTVFLTTVMTDAFGQTRSKRPYALVSAGAPLAGIVTGVILHYEASVVTAVQTLQVIAGLDCAVVILLTITHFMSKKNVDEFTPTNINAFDKRVPHLVEGTSRITHGIRATVERYRFHLGALIIFKTAALTLIGYQWKFSASVYLHEQETSLIAFFAAYYAVTDVLILVTQFFISGRLLDRFGIRLALIGYPCLLIMLGIIAFLIKTPFEWFALLTITRGADVIRRSLHDPALAAAFASIAAKRRRRTIVFINGILKPIAEVLTALALLLYADGIAFQSLTIYWCFTLLLWLSAAWGVCHLRRRRDTIT